MSGHESLVLSHESGVNRECRLLNGEPQDFGIRSGEFGITRIDFYT